MTPNHQSINRQEILDIVLRNPRLLSRMEEHNKAREQKLRERKHLFSLLSERFFVAETCIKITADYFKLGKHGVEQIKSPSRAASIAWPRHCAMTLAYELSGLSLVELATLFNRKDHSTIHYAIGRVGAACNNPEVKKMLGALKRKAIKELE